MRLDKYLAHSLRQSRAKVKSLVRRGAVQINGQVVTDAGAQVAQLDAVTCQGRPIMAASKQYIALYKPANYICSTQDEHYPSALNLLQKPPFRSLHFAGRLDADTTGLVLISDDGQWSHRVTSPSRQCVKVYRVITYQHLTQTQLLTLADGVRLKNDDQPTLPAQVNRLGENECLLGLSEGRYHQVKRMFAAVGNHVVSLHREKVGGVDLSGLEVGCWRHLSKEEIESF